MGGAAPTIAANVVTAGLYTPAKATVDAAVRNPDISKNVITAGLYSPTQALIKKGGVTDTVSGNRARREATQQLNDAQERSNAQAAGLASQQAAEQAKQDAIANRNKQLQRFRALRLGAGGRASTILTGSLGLSGSADTAQHTLLGQ